MKYFVKFIIFCFIAVNLQATSYIYVKEGVKLPLYKQKITLYGGSPVEIIDKKGNSVKIELSGYVNKSDKKKLFATKNFKLLLASVKNKKSIKVSGDKGVLNAVVLKNDLTNDIDEAWQANSDLFYDKCTKCHHAKIIDHHTMLDWEALFGSMKLKAKTTKKQNVLILRFLRAFAKDGILKQSN